MGAEASLMSGSGPTVFGVFNSREKSWGCCGGDEALLEQGC